MSEPEEESGNIEELVANPNFVKMDSGIFNFMTVEKTVDYYNKIHENGGVLDIEWTFYKKRQSNCERENEKAAKKVNETQEEDLSKTSATQNTEFDFDLDELDDLQTTTSLVNDSLSLTKRELGTDKKTSISDIMTDLRKNQPASQQQ